MPKFGKRSKKELATAHPDLQRLFNEVIKTFDCAVICGHRSRADQEKAVKSGASDAPWPKSDHNKTPSRAVDVVPYPSMWDDPEKFYDLALEVKAAAHRLNIRVKWGGDYKETAKRPAGWDKPHWYLA